MSREIGERLVCVVIYCTCTYDCLYVVGDEIVVKLLESRTALEWIHTLPNV